jgi:hypothetical protein
VAVGCSVKDTDAGVVCIIIAIKYLVACLVLDAVNSLYTFEAVSILSEGVLLLSYCFYL